MSDKNHEAGFTDQFVLESEADRSRTPVADKITVGRGPDCDLVLSSEKSSRLHAKVSVKDGALWVEDQGSTNGTLVNKKKISKNTRLEDGDIVQFGDVRFRVLVPKPAADEADDQGTVMIGQQTQLHSGEQQQPAEDARLEAPAEKSSGAEKQQLPEKAGEAAPESSGKTKASKADSDSEATDSGKSRESGKPEQPETKAKESRKREEPRADESRPEEPESPSVEGRAAEDPSIPRSWADADQLEQASHTAFVASPPKSAADAESGALHPLKAIAQARRSIPADEAILVGLTEPIQGKPFKLSRKGDTEKWEMGRGKGADIDIDDESVSGRHAQLIYERGRWKVVNMMSVNGTFVNERKVLSAYLGPRDVIRMGTVELVFDARVEKPKPQSQAGKAGRGGKKSAGGIVARLAKGVRTMWQSLVNRLRGKG
jgi:pSer/pThr/pTyr-binding forkhead associated (FHA) protein